MTKRTIEIRLNGKMRQRTEVQCDCGRQVLCLNFTNTCRCGADYNMSGQLLADRRQWGEETGETVADILSERDPEDF